MSIIWLIYQLFYVEKEAGNGSSLKTCKKLLDKAYRAIFLTLTKRL